MEQDIIHLNEKLYLSWSKNCWKSGKDGLPWVEIEKAIKKMFKKLNFMKTNKRND